MLTEDLLKDLTTDDLFEILRSKLEELENSEKEGSDIKYRISLVKELETIQLLIDERNKK